MPIIKWKTPVHISTDTRDSESVSSAFEAVIFLADSRLDGSPGSFIEARDACRGALAGRVDTEMARAKFLAAVKAAKMRVN